MGEQLHSGAVTFIMISYTRILFSRLYVASSLHVHTLHPLSTFIRRILLSRSHAAFIYSISYPSVS